MFSRRDFVKTAVLGAAGAAAGPEAFRRAAAAASPHAAGAVLQADAFRHYVDLFNARDEELYVQAVPNRRAWDFLSDNMPLFECPEKELEKTYYFRWWTFRKHVKETPDGYVITEFLPPVGWSGKHNTISCPAGHHFNEGRWLRDRRYLDEYAVFWFRKGGEPRRYSFWAATALYDRYRATGDPSLVLELLPDLVANYEAWEASHLGENGLFWQIDDRDGMEVSIGGSGYRATINAYQYGDARAIARIAEMAGRDDLARTYRRKAADVRRLVQSLLWDPQDRFFKVRSRETGRLAGVRELHGYTPWYTGLPDAGGGYAEAWAQLMDTGGFLAPYGPTTAEQRHPECRISYEGHECQWNGPSWPFATSVTLTALANLLNDYDQQVVSARDYYTLLEIYSRSHRRMRADGVTLPWIDENLNPYTGDWIARTRLMQWDDGTWSDDKGGRERGKDYNHSTFCDLVITGLVGLRPQADDRVVVNPLVPEGAWSYFCLDRVPYHGRDLTVVWDRTGERYGLGPGLHVLSDGVEVARADALQRLEAPLS